MAAYYLPQVAQQLLQSQHGSAVALLQSLIALQQALWNQRLLSALPSHAPTGAVTGLFLGIEVFCVRIEVTYAKGYGRLDGCICLAVEILVGSKTIICILTNLPNYSLHGEAHAVCVVRRVAAASGATAKPL